MCFRTDWFAVTDQTAAPRNFTRTTRNNSTTGRSNCLKHLTAVVNCLLSKWVNRQLDDHQLSIEWTVNCLLNNWVNHYNTPLATQYLTTHQTTVPLYPNPPPLHAIPYTTSPSSTPTQSLHRPQTSALAPQTHYPTFPRIVIQPESHTPHLNTQDGYQRTTQRGTTANDHIFLWEVMHNVQQQ